MDIPDPYDDHVLRWEWRQYLVVRYATALLYLPPGYVPLPRAVCQRQLQGTVTLLFSKLKDRFQIGATRSPSANSTPSSNEEAEKPLHPVMPLVTIECPD